MHEEGIIGRAITTGIPPAATEATALHENYLPILGKYLGRIELNKLDGHVVTIRPSVGTHLVSVEGVLVKDGWYLEKAALNHPRYACAAYSFVGNSLHVTSCSHLGGPSGGKAMSGKCNWPTCGHNGHPAPFRIFVEFAVFRWECREEAWVSPSTRSVRDVISAVLHRWPFLMPLLPDRLFSLMDSALRTNLVEGRPSRQLSVTLRDLHCVREFLRSSSVFWGPPVLSKWPSF